MKAKASASARSGEGMPFLRIARLLSNFTWPELVTS